MNRLQSWILPSSSSSSSSVHPPEVTTISGVSTSTSAYDVLVTTPLLNLWPTASFYENETNELDTSNTTLGELLVSRTMLNLSTVLPPFLVGGDENATINNSSDDDIRFTSSQYPPTISTPTFALNATDQGSMGPDLRIHHPGLAIVLSLISVIVVFGNILTMLSIYKERYLQTVTNYFVASLAAADCLVGAVVMPFSMVHEVMNKWWIFGQNWCDLWHSLDVLATTASILNLCVISLDRYWAITNPITYPSRMTPSKASLFIFGLWFCSALISFPAIAWWRAVQKEPVEQFRCLFTDDIGYLVFSSTISFYGPLMVMVFTYYRIYVVASKQTRSLKLGVKQIELSAMGEAGGGGSGGGGGTTGVPYGETTGFTLRMHRGGGAGATPVIPNNHHHHHHNNNNNHYTCPCQQHHGRGGGGGGVGSSTSTDAFVGVAVRQPKSSTMDQIAKKGSLGSGDNIYHCDCDTSMDTNVHCAGNSSSNNKMCNRSQHKSSMAVHSSMVDVNSSAAQPGGRHVRNYKASNWSVGKRLAKLAKERKAAKTLGIVMGVFILCWLPFFVTNILMGICPETCILRPDLVLSVVTWLGWMNSAMNPVIYACWSKDFRRAFRKILCSCFLSNQNLSYNRNRVYKAQNNRCNYYYKSKMTTTINRRDANNNRGQQQQQQQQQARTTRAAPTDSMAQKMGLAKNGNNNGSGNSKSTSTTAAAVMAHDLS